MEEIMTEVDFEEVLQNILQHMVRVPGLSVEHHIRDVFPLREHTGVADKGPGLIIILNNGAEFELSISRS